MTKYLVKFIFVDGSEFISGNAFDTLFSANWHAENMLACPDWNTSDCKVLRYVVGIAEVRF